MATWCGAHNPKLRLVETTLVNFHELTFIKITFFLAFKRHEGNLLEKDAKLLSSRF